MSRQATKNANELEYLVRWKGFTQEDDNWEHEKDIEDSLITAFEERKVNVDVFTDFFVEMHNPLRSIVHFPARTALVFFPTKKETVSERAKRRENEVIYFTQLAAINKYTMNYNYLKLVVKVLLIVKPDISQFLELNTNYLLNRVGRCSKKVRDHPALMACVGTHLKIPPYDKGISNQSLNNIERQRAET